MLIDAGPSAEDQLGHAQTAKETKRRLGDELSPKASSRSGPHQALQMQLGVRFVDLSAIDPTPS
ncbi:MAG: hypothetical protein ACLU7P_06675 [Eggerthella lenta]